MKDIILQAEVLHYYLETFCACMIGFQTLNLLSLHRTFKNSVVSSHVSIFNGSLFNLLKIV